MPYGISFAQKLLDAGKWDEAIAEATKASEREPDEPEPFFERATAYANLDRYVEAAADFERALELDREAGVLQSDFVDDAYFQRAARRGARRVGGGRGRAAGPLSENPPPGTAPERRRRLAKTAARRAAVSLRQRAPGILIVGSFFRAR